jgi:hypothetical protein
MRSQSRRRVQDGRRSISRDRFGGAVEQTRERERT